MDTKQQIEFETIEDVVKYTESNPLAITLRRWKLSKNTHHPYIDKKAGQKWHDEYYGIPYVSINEPGYKDYVLRKEHLEKQEPKRTTVTDYYLIDNSGYRSIYLYLSKELYDLFDSVWTKSPRWRGSNEMENKSSLTLPGLLKRLGNTSVADKIKQAEQAQKALLEKRARNYERKQIREQSQKLFELLKSTNIVQWDSGTSQKDLDFFVRLVSLTKLEDEE